MVRSFCSMDAKDKTRFFAQAEMAFDGADEATGGEFSLTSLLKGDEKVVYETRAHWFFIVPYVIAALLLSRFTMGISLLLIIPAFFKIKTHEYIVTCERIVAREGFWRSRVISLPLKSIEKTEVKCSDFDKKLGRGNISLTTTGGSTLTFKNIEDPHAMSHYIRSAMIVLPYA